MAALALLEKARGGDVSGCDIHSSPRTVWLESRGIRVERGHSPSHLDGVDALVVTNAVSSANPEIEAARARGVEIVRRGELLASIVSSRDSVAVCGTHGKTTTSTFVARLLLSLGEDVSWAIGGETGGFPVAGACDGFAQGKGVLVVEADESDGTLALYAPSTLVVTNCEFDHPDHFRDFAEYKACFDAARGRARDVIESEALPMFPSGFSGGVFDFLRSLPRHNAANARAAAEVALRRGHGIRETAAKLREIVRELPDRRFQTIVPDCSCGAVVTDYAHHPTEMKCAVEMARRSCTGRLRVLFQPHRYSRTKALLQSFPGALEGADEIILCPTYAAFEPYLEGGGMAHLYAACREASLNVKLARDCREAWRHACLESHRGDVTLLLGAGDIVDVARLARADAASAAPPCDGFRELKDFSFFRTGGRTTSGGAVRTVGMGSNLWISDLTTDVDYRRLPGGDIERTACGTLIAPAGIPGARLSVPWMAGIPGTVGGWIKMNAGAFGHSISEAVRRVKVDGRWMDASMCGFAYRTSSISGTVEAAEFVPARGDCAEFLARRKTFPPRCCGSVFKNPQGDFAGRMLEECGAKGMSVGGARVWDGHANVVYAQDGATSSDILALTLLMREKVFVRFGVDLEPEIEGLKMPLC